jgi:hypothetical protein
MASVQMQRREDRAGWQGKKIVVIMERARDALRPSGTPTSLTSGCRRN